MVLQIRSLIYMQFRGVRSKVVAKHRPPYPFFFRSMGWRECGPYYEELFDWPERYTGWSMIPDYFPKRAPEPSFVNDEKSQKTGYPDPITNSFVTVDDATPELVVPPDLDTCKLKPYVSFRTLETEADVPAITARDLFQIFYAERVTESFKEGKYAKEETIFEDVRDKKARKKTLAEKGLPILDDGGVHSVA